MIDVKGRAKRPGKGNIWITLAAMCGVSALLGTGSYYGYRYYCEKVNDGFLKGTYVDGEDVYGLTPEAAVDKILAKYADSQIVITEGENTDLTGDLASYGYEIDRKGLTEELKTAITVQKSDGVAVLESVFDRYESEIEAKPQENTAVFEQKVSVASLETARYPSEDAYLYYDQDADCIAIKPEVQGNEITDDALREYVRDCIRRTLAGEPAAAVTEPAASEAATTETAAAGHTSAETAAETEPAAGGQPQEAAGPNAQQQSEAGADVQPQAEAGQDVQPQAEEGLHRSFEFPWEMCTKPEVYANDAALTARRDAINQYAGAGITYTFGDKTEEYNLLDLADLMDIEDGKAQLSDEKIEAFVEDLAARYNTRYLDRTFQSTLAGEITIPAKYNDYGYTIIQANEAEQIREDIESRSHVTREPVYLETNSWGNPYYLRRNGEDDLDGTYIEVDLTAQHVWFYKDGEVYAETDCVSGDVTKDRGTRTGCFPLAYKESPSVLRGGEGDGEYEEHVQYWMPFFEGQGLHDASWRYYFGGNIYRGNGSHGCVNLPTWAAAEIYEAVETGTAIVIFYE